MTAAQKANRERFKKVIAEAKKLRAKNKKLTQAQAVKQAWAIMYSKGVAGLDKVTKKGSKTTVHYSKKIGNVTLKKANYHPRDERYIIMNDGIPHLDGKPFFKGEAKEIADALRKVKASRKKAKAKVSGVKKPVETKHEDTRSHNVNIKVVSGIAAIRGGSKFMLYKGMTIEKKPVTIGKKKAYVYISGGMVWNTLADAKRYILHLSR